MRIKQIIYPVLLAAMLLTAACEEIPTRFETEENLISIADFLYENEDEFSTFIRIMQESDIENTLRAYNPNGDKYTLFLPGNAAFENYFSANGNYSGLEALLSDSDFTRVLSRYHVVNSQIESNNFPLGALPDSCLTGDFLIIAYVQDADSTYYRVNSKAKLEQRDLKMTNGYVHVIDHVLEPIVQSGFEWLRANDDYSIISDLFELTGLVDTMGLYITDEKGKVRRNTYSLLVEADSIFNKSGIMSMDDLISKFGNGNDDYTNDENPIYQLAAYHILADSRFLADLFDGENNYNTYASLPVKINSDINVWVNEGVENFDSIYSEQDTVYSYINYIEIMVNESNVQTVNGPIHFIDQVMRLYQPAQSRRTFEFYEEPLIDAIRKEEREFIFTDVDKFSKMSWSGVEEIKWVKSPDDSEKASNKDYIEIEGDFLVSYDIPKILPGKYELQLKANNDEKSNATIQVFLDGKQIGSNMNLTTGGQNNSNPYRTLTLGVVEFSVYEEHTVSVRSLIPGRFVWDWVRFESDFD